MPPSAVDAIEPAIQHTRQQLFCPFRFSQWIRIAFVGVLAGEAGSGGGGNFNYNIPSTHRNTGAGPDQTTFAGTSLPPFIAQHMAAFIVLIVVAIVVGIVLTVVFTYISSVMRFVLFDSVLTRECHVRAGWRRRKREGMRLFLWQLVFGVVELAALVILIGIPVFVAWQLGWFADARAHLVGLIVGGVALFFLFLFLVFAFLLVFVITKDFVVPQMAFEDIGVMEGWRRLLPMMQTEKGRYAGYIGMKIVLTIAAAIIFAIITIVAVLIMLIPIGGVGLIAFLTGKAMGLAWNAPVIAVAVISGIAVFLFFICAIFFICVPTYVFFPAYAIYFFAPRFPPLAAQLWPASAAPPIPPLPNPIG